MRLSLVGQRDLETDDFIKPQRDYSITLIGSLLSTENFVDEDVDSVKFKIKISHIENITDLKEHKEIKFEKGKSPSQKLKWRIEEKLGEEEYQSFMSYLMTRIDEISDNYIDNLQK